jgi:hypothetical protein
MNAVHLIQRSPTHKLLLSALVAVALLAASSTDSQAATWPPYRGEGQTTVTWNDSSRTTAYVTCMRDRTPYGWVLGAFEPGQLYYRYPDTYVVFRIYAQDGTLLAEDRDWIGIPKSTLGVNWAEGIPNTRRVAVTAAFWHNGEQTPWLLVGRVNFDYDGTGRLMCMYAN